MYYMDWLDHRDGPVDRFVTPRIGLFDDDMVTKLCKADILRAGQRIIGYGKLEVSSPSCSLVITNYIVLSPITCMCTY